MLISDGAIIPFVFQNTEEGNVYETTIITVVRIEFLATVNILGLTE
jgi:hypothetical protein